MENTLGKNRHYLPDSNFHLDKAPSRLANRRRNHRACLVFLAGHFEFIGPKSCSIAWVPLCLDVNRMGTHAIEYGEGKTEGYRLIRFS